MPRVFMPKAHTVVNLSFLRSGRLLSHLRVRAARSMTAALDGKLGRIHLGVGHNQHPALPAPRRQLLPQSCCRIGTEATAV